MILQRQSGELYHGSVIEYEGIARERLPGLEGSEM